MPVQAPMRSPRRVLGALLVALVAIGGVAGFLVQRSAGAGPRALLLGESVADSEFAAHLPLVIREPVPTATQTPASPTPVGGVIQFVGTTNQGRAVYLEVAADLSTVNRLYIECEIGCQGEVRLQTKASSEALAIANRGFRLRQFVAPRKEDVIVGQLSADLATVSGTWTLWLVDPHPVCSNSGTWTASRGVIPTATVTPLHSATPTHSPTLTRSPTATSSLTATPSTPTVTRTPGPSLTPTVTGGPTATTTPTSTPIYADDFQDSGSGWDTQSGTRYHRGYRDGEYQIQIGWANSEWPVIEGSDSLSGDIDVQVTARHVDSGGERAYALLFRAADDDHLYRFAVAAGTQEYSLGKFDVDSTGNPEYDALVPWSVSSAINGGNDPNVLRAVCQGSQIMLYVNGVFLQSVSDSSYLEGRVGMDAISFANTSGVDARFDNLTVYRPGERPPD